MNWREYEDLVIQFLKSEFPRCIIESNVKLPGRLSGERQIDAVIKYRFGGQESLAIVNAKQYKRKVDKGVIDELFSVMDDVGASIGIIISTSGFTKGADAYASNSNRIQLIQFKESQFISNEVFVPIMLAQYEIHINFHYEMSANETVSEETTIDASSTKLVIDGKSFTVLEYFDHLWNSNQISKATGKHTLRIESNENQLMLQGNTRAWNLNLNVLEMIWTPKRTAKLVRVPPDRLYDITQDGKESKWGVMKFDPLQEFRNPKLPFSIIAKNEEFEKHKNGILIEMTPNIKNGKVGNYSIRVS